MASNILRKQKCSWWQKKDETVNLVEASKYQVSGLQQWIHIKDKDIQRNIKTTVNFFIICLHNINIYIYIYDFSNNLSFLLF